MPRKRTTGAKVPSHLVPGVQFPRPQPVNRGAVVKTARQAITEAMNDEVMMYDSDEENADQIIAAIDAAGYKIVPKNDTEAMLQRIKER